MSCSRNEGIVSAQYVSRPSETKFPGLIPHAGVRVTTDSGSSCLIHNTPRSGTVVTDASNMSSRWGDVCTLLLLLLPLPLRRRRLLLMQLHLLLLLGLLLLLLLPHCRQCLLKLTQLMG